MNQRTKSKTYKILRNNIILSVILTILLIVTGVMPYLIELSVALFRGDTQVAISYGVGAFGVVIGFIVSVMGLIIGLSTLLIPLAIGYSLLKHHHLGKAESEDI